VLDVCIQDGDPIIPGQRGVVLMGPSGSPGMFRVDVRTVAHSIYLPVAKREAAQP
jgi:hypothetical protein